MVIFKKYTLVTIRDMKKMFAITSFKKYCSEKNLEERK